MSTIIGAKLSSSLSAAEATTEGKGFGLGDRHTDHAGNEYVYVEAGAAITIYDTVHVSGAYVANSLTPALALTAGFIGHAQVAFTTGERGWVMTRGKPVIRVALDADSGVPLYTTDTAGVLDDATASSSQRLVLGVQIIATASGTAASAVTAVSSFPMIKRTDGV